MIIDSRLGHWKRISVGFLVGPVWTPIHTSYASYTKKGPWNGTNPTRVKGVQKTGRIEKPEHRILAKRSPYYPALMWPHVPFEGAL